MAFDFSKHAGAGQDSIDDSVLGMPLLNIIQSGSPQIKPSHKDYAMKKITGAMPGDVVFAPTNRLVPRPIEVIVLDTTQVYTEWKPKKEGGGFVGTHSADIITHANYRTGEKGTDDEHKEYLGSNELKYTIYIAVSLLLDGQRKKAIIGFQSTALKPARAWLKQIKNLRLAGSNTPAPVFAATWKLDTQPEQNDSGDWMGWKIEFGKMLDATDDEETLVQVATDHLSVRRDMLPAPRAEKALANGPVTPDVVDDERLY